MEKIKRFIECEIPTETCNFRCHYCYITQHRKFNNKLLKLQYSSDYIAQALSKERLGGTCLFNLCAGGETLLVEEIIDLIKAILEKGHYLMLVSNCSLTDRIKKICEFPQELLNHLFFKCSFHYLELKRLNLLDKYVENINLLKKSGVSLTIEITPTDELEPYINEIKEFSMKNFGALPHITVGRKDSDDIPPLTEHSFEEYKKIWSEFDSELFKFKSEIFGRKIKEFCYAGDWSVFLNIETGELKQCYTGLTIDNIYEDIERPIKFLPIGCSCNQPHCYNGHAFLAFGNVPEFETVTYCEERDRVCLDGSHWITEDMRNFMKTKLKDSNKELTEEEKIKIIELNKNKRINK